MSLQWVWWIAAGYLFGSVPFAWLIGRAHGVDIRHHGSGNVGATNVGRTVGRFWGGLCLVMDAAKGTVPVLLSGLAMQATGDGEADTAKTWAWLAVAAAAVVGHVYPVWLGFRGGKGVATGLGVLLGFWPTLTVPALAALITWLVVAAVFRYVGLASVVAAASIPAYLLIATAADERPFIDMLPDVLPFLVVTTLMGLLVVVRHAGNLHRIYLGVEPRIGT